MSSRENRAGGYYQIRERYRTIIQLLQVNKYLTGRRLCELVLERVYDDSPSFKYATRTLNYDIEQLKNEHDAPIDNKKGPGGGYYLKDKNYSFDDSPVTEKELVILKDTIATLRQFEDLALFKDFKRVLKQVETRVNMADIQDYSEASVRFQRPFDLKGAEFFQPLLATIKDERKVEVTYRKFQMDALTSITDPYLLKEYDNAWYLLGRNPDGSFRTYALDRVEGVEPYQSNDGRDYFVRDKNFDPDEFYKYCFGIYSFEEPPTKIVLKVAKTLSNYFRVRSLHSSQEIIKDLNGQLTIQIEVIETIEVIKELLKHGTEIKVIKPVDLFDRWESKLNELKVI